MDFIALSIEHVDLFHRYLGDYPFQTYEYSFAALYQWRKLCQPEFCVVDDVLVVKKTINGLGSYFMQPIGLQSPKMDQVIARLIDFKRSHPGFKFLFGDVESSFLEQLQQYYGSRATCVEHENNFDYIYNVSDLLTLSGNRYHRKKNQYNQFVNNYDYEIRDLGDEQVRRDCLDFATRWYANNAQEDAVLEYELDGVHDVLENVAKLKILGIAVYVHGQMAGFAFGERVNESMAVVHCEKGDVSYSGIYAFLNRTLVETHFRDARLVNRQEDMGLEGLRRAKMAYHPTRLEKKYFVDIAPSTLT